MAALILLIAIEIALLGNGIVRLYFNQSSIRDF